MTTTIYEPARDLAWLDTTLSAVATATGATGAYEGVAPDSTTGYYIVYNLQASSDIAGAAGIRLWASSLYLVKVVGPVTSFAAMVVTADAVDTALQLAGEVVTGPNSDGYLMRCTREGAVPLPGEVVDGVYWPVIAALWRLQSRKRT